MFANLPLNTGGSDDREQAPCPMHLARKTQQVPDLKSPAIQVDHLSRFHNARFAKTTRNNA